MQPHPSDHAPLSLEGLLHRAYAEAGSDDFGTRSFLPPLRKFVESVNAGIGELHDAGRRAVEDRVVRLLVNRLRMQMDIKADSRILDQVLLPPAAIIGLPRTGSTKLQRLLAAGHGFNELLLWQAINPAPFPSTAPCTGDPRIQAGAEFVASVARQSPDSHKGHMMVAEGTEEESHLLDQTFETPSLISFLPAYGWCRFIERTDKTDMYAHLRNNLKYLQWQFHRNDDKRWLLKYPANLGNESYMDRAFPGVQYIVTHRDPFPVLASLSRLVAATRLVYCRPQDMLQFSRWALEEFASEMERHLAWREANPSAPVLDVAFKDIINNAGAVAREIHAFLGLDWAPETDAQIRGWLAENEQQKDKLEYTMDELAFTEQECHARFADYYQRFAPLF